MKSIFVKLGIVYSCLMCSVYSGYGQIYNGNILLTTQAEVDSFGTNGYTQIIGDLSIEDSISSLSGLLGLKAIYGNVILDHTTLHTLAGLDSITFVGGDLIIKENTGLTSLDALNGVSSIIGDLELNNNDGLLTLSGLSSIQYIGGNLYVYENNLISNFSGLDGLALVDGDVWVKSNEALSSCLGLQQLAVVNGRFIVTDNIGLLNFNGLTALSSIGDNVTIRDNDNLLSFEGLNNLKEINGGLTIEEHALLHTLNGLDSLKDCNGIRIHQNSSLIDYCALNTLFSINGTSVYVSVHSNAFNPTVLDLRNGDCDIVLSVLNPNVLSELTYYPNPVIKSVEVYLGTLQNVDIHVINPLGQVIFSETGISSPTYTFNLEGQSGLYILNVRSDIYNKQMRIIKR